MLRKRPSLLLLTTFVFHFLTACLEATGLVITMRGAKLFCVNWVVFVIPELHRVVGKGLNERRWNVCDTGRVAPDIPREKVIIASVARLLSVLRVNGSSQRVLIPSISSGTRSVRVASYLVCILNHLASAGRWVSIASRLGLLPSSCDIYW